MSNFISIPISSVVVWIRGEKKDKVVVQTLAPSPERTNSKDNFVIQFEIAPGRGKDFVEKWFGVKPLVIDEKTSQVIQNFSGGAHSVTEQKSPIIEERVQVDTTQVTPSLMGNTSVIESLESKKQNASDRSIYFEKPQAENVNTWKSVVYDSKYYTIYGMLKGEWVPFINKATREECLSWFTSKGKSYGNQVLDDSISAS
jgi:hypothetical protein